MKRAVCFGLALGLLLVQHSGSAHAVSIELVPSSQSVSIGDPIDVEIVALDLVGGGPPSLSTFDLNVLFDPLILAFDSVLFGDPVLGDQLDLFGSGGNPTSAGLVGPGTLNLFELSLDLPSDLNALQVGSFTLATLTFDTLAFGASPLNLSINALGDASGDPLSSTVGTGSVNVVPEPATVLLRGSGLAGIAGLAGRKRLSKRLKKP